MWTEGFSWIKRGTRQDVFSFTEVKPFVSRVKKPFPVCQGKRIDFYKLVLRKILEVTKYKNTR
jgi:hypothetical protein